MRPIEIFFKFSCQTPVPAQSAHDSSIHCRISIFDKFCYTDFQLISSKFCCCIIRIMLKCSYVLLECVFVGARLVVTKNTNIFIYKSRM